MKCWREWEGKPCAEFQCKYLKPLVTGVCFDKFLYTFPDFLFLFFFLFSFLSIPFSFSFLFLFFSFPFLLFYFVFFAFLSSPPLSIIPSFHSHNTSSPATQHCLPQQPIMAPHNLTFSINPSNSLVISNLNSLSPLTGFLTIKCGALWSTQTLTTPPLTHPPT